MNKKGFTLIELIIVIVILAILAMIAIPAVSKFVVQASQNTCDNNLATLSRSMENIKITHENEKIEKVYEEALKESQSHCPVNGEYRLIQSSFKVAYPICAVHTKNVAIGESYYFTKDIIAEMKADPEKFGLDADWKKNSNDELTNAILKHYDFGKLNIGDKDYFIEPYYNASTSSIMVFAKARDDYQKQNWNADFIYYPEDGKWYTGNKSLIVCNIPAEEVYQKMLDANWKPITDPSEIRAKKK